MSVIRSAKIVELARAENPKQALIDAVDVSGINILGDNLLVATYIRPEKTKGGIIRPESNVQEDEFQGNVGLVLVEGRGLLEDEDYDDSGSVFLHQWVMFGYNDGLRFRYNDVPCRIIDVGRIRGIIPDPSKVL